MTKTILVLLASLTFAIAPFLSPDFGGFDPDRYPVPQKNSPVQPVGWAFSIWGLIYLGLVAHAILGLIKYRKDANWDIGRNSLLLSLVVGTVWLPIARISPLWATVLIWVMLISALACLYRSRKASPAWAASWPVALYAGWLTAASFVSIGLLLAGYAFLTETVAAVVALVGALLFATINQIKLSLWPYAAAASWGFVGIAVTNYERNDVISLLSVMAAGALIAISASQSLGLLSRNSD